MTILEELYDPILPLRLAILIPMSEVNNESNESNFGVRRTSDACFTVSSLRGVTSTKVHNANC